MARQPQAVRTCNICYRTLDALDDPTTEDCGGDCLRCMAMVGDPDCIAAMNKILRDLLRAAVPFMDCGPTDDEDAYKGLVRKIESALGDKS